MNTVATETVSVNARTVVSTCTSASRGRLAGRNARSSDIVQKVSARPSAPPAAAMMPALDHDLAEHRPAAGAERGSQGELPFPRGRPGQQQVGHVGAGDEQHQPHRAHQQEQSRPGMLYHVVQERDHPDAEVRRRVHRELVPELLGDEVHLRLRLCPRDPRREPPVDAEPRVVPRRRLAVVVLKRGPEVGVRHHERLGGQKQSELPRQDTHYLVRDAVHGDGAADERGIAGIAPLPQPVTQDHDLGPVGLLFLRGEVAAERRGHAEQWEEVRGDRREIHPLGIAVPGQVASEAHEPGAGGGGEVLECATPLLVVPEIQRGHRGQGLGTLAHVVPDDRQPIRVYDKAAAAAVPRSRR